MDPVPFTTNLQGEQDHWCNSGRRAMGAINCSLIGFEAHWMGELSCMILKIWGKKVCG